MGKTFNNAGLILEKETDTDVWTFEAILQPINSAANVRGSSISHDVKSVPCTIDVSPNSQGAKLAPTKQQGFQEVQHQPCTKFAPTPAPREINTAPLIFAGLMTAVISFHLYGAVQYYRGTVDSKVECKQ